MQEQTYLGTTTGDPHDGARLPDFIGGEDESQRLPILIARAVSRESQIVAVIPWHLVPCPLRAGPTLNSSALGFLGCMYGLGSLPYVYPFRTRRVTRLDIKRDGRRPPCCISSIDAPIHEESPAKRHQHENAGGLVLEATYRLIAGPSPAKRQVCRHDAAES